MDPERAHGIMEYFSSFKSAISGGLVVQVLQLGAFSLLASLLSVVFHVYASRKLGPEGYGELGVLVSMISALLILLSSIYLIINKFMAQYRTRGQAENMKFLIKLGFVDSFMLGLASFVLIIILSDVFAVFLRFESNKTIILFGLVVWFSFLAPVLEGIFRGMQSFKSVGFQKLAEAVARLVLLGAFLFLGWGVDGAVLALAFGTLVGIVVCIGPLYKFKNTNSHRIYLGEFYHYAVPVILASLLVAILLNLDVVLVKHFFAPHEAGFFVAAGTIAKVPFMLAAALGSVLFSRVAEAFGDGKPTRKMLKDTLVYVGIISVIVLVLVHFYAAGIALAFFGPDYPVAGFLFWYVLAFVCFSFVNVFVLYDLARKKYRSIGILFAGLVAELCLLLLFHDSLLQVSIFVLLVMAGLLVFCFTAEREELLF